MLATSYATTLLFHQLIKRYVFCISKGPTADSLQLQLPTLLGFMRTEHVPLGQLFKGDSLFCTWARVVDNKQHGYLIQYDPESCLQSWNGQAINSRRFNQIFTAILARGRS